MKNFNVELCETCPSRGLCVGNVALSIVPVTFGEGAHTVSGYGLNATDQDGVVQAIRYIVPQKYTFSTRRGEKTNGTEFLVSDRSKNVRSDTIFAAMERDQEAFKNAVQERASKCSGPDAKKERGNFVISYEKRCRATAELVLEALVTKPYNPTTNT